MQVTRLLEEAGKGNRFASDELLPLVYDELRRLAARRIEREAPGQTLQATALVHEAYLRLVGDGSPTWDNKGHFFGAAAQAMRRILVERARRVGSAKRGGGRDRVPLTDLEVAAIDDAVDFVALDDALRRMEREDARAAQIVMLRFFAGLEIEETAATLGLSASTVKREWTCARAWLYDELRRNLERNSS
ncbi:MAG: sigma-70 family RNA polymerase sigma factor [Phycisphaerae bacterium]|nr:sigma-70 family RNA polymerase sigma factor [Phycisphaerae bacterium]